MKVSKKRVGAIFRKELREYRRNRSLVTGMAIIPLVFLAQPLTAVFTTSASAAAELAHRHELLYVLGIPALVPATLAAYAVVGERQQGTLEPVLGTPIRSDELLLAKALAVLIPSVGISYVVYGVFLASVELFAQRSVADALVRGPDVLSQSVRGDLVSRRCPKRQLESLWFEEFVLRCRLELDVLGLPLSQFVANSKGHEYEGGIIGRHEDVRAVPGGRIEKHAFPHGRRAHWEFAHGRCRQGTIDRTATSGDCEAVIALRWRLRYVGWEGCPAGEVFLAEQRREAVTQDDDVRPHGRPDDVSGHPTTHRVDYFDRTLGCLLAPQIAAEGLCREPTEQLATIGSIREWVV
jgi:ABC-2 family transporter protein